MTLFEKLDYVLTFMLNDNTDNGHNSAGNYTLDILFSKIEDELKTDSLEFTRFLNKLKNDEYIKIDGHDKNRPFFYNEPFQITFDGILFIKQGGYHQREIDIQLKRELDKAEITRIKKHDQYLTCGSLLAGIGTGGILLLEVLKLWGVIK